ncbi:MAG: hypothetical protein QXR89_04775 [Candidatus Bathyarchaeia archaeon]
MSADEVILGVINSFRTSYLRWRTLFEDLYFTTNRVIVAKIGSGSYLISPVGVLVRWPKTAKQEFVGFSAEELLKANQNNFAIYYSEVRSVELKKHGLGAKIRLITDEKKYEWYVRGIPGKKDAKIEDYESILKTVFPNKLSVSK